MNHNHPILRKPNTGSARPPRGFTLVEMMVATALVVLMMLMFAQIFQVASGLTSNQKGMAENDQSVRTLTILLRGDIKQRTFLDVVPYVAGQATDNPLTPGYDSARQKGYDANFRQGYFSISENDPNNKTDDSLSLTITTRSPARNPDDRDKELPYSGRATLLRRPEALGGLTDMDLDQPAERNAYLTTNPDQPEFDDGQLDENATGSSEYAEVSWFLRNGTLYRRQMLIRRPYNRGTNTSQPEDPQDANANEFIPAAYGAASIRPNANAKGVFWHDFDYAAYAGISNDVKFHSLPDALSNDSTTTAIADLQLFPPSLGVPFLRFGSSVSRATRTMGVVRIFGPREFLGPDYGQGGFDPTNYIGRFNVQETAHSNFNYPGNGSAGDPFANSTSLGLNPDFLVGAYADERQRRGEDIVMTNVHEFDIQVWDDALTDFADIGHNRQNAAMVDGWYNLSRNQSPGGDFGNRYDTWHPYADMPALPPYAPFGPNASNPAIPGPPRNAANNNGLGADEEIWLRAIRIKIRFYDEGSEQMRDLTFTFRLNRDNSAK